MKKAWGIWGAGLTEEPQLQEETRPSLRIFWGYLLSEVVKWGGENGVARSPCFGDIITEKGYIQR